MTTDELRERLLELGMDVHLEVQERQLVLIPRGRIDAVRDASVRHHVLEVARSAGFTHVSVEIVDPGHAPLYRDQPA